MANLTSSTPGAVTPSTPATSPTPTSSVPPATTPSSAAPVTTPPTSSSSTPLPPATTPSTSSTPPTSSTSTPPTSSSTTPVPTPTTASTTQAQTTVVVTYTPTDNGTPVVSVVTFTTVPSQTSQSSSSSASSSATAGVAGQSNSVSKSGLSDSGKIAVEVVVPIIAVALLVLGGIFFWRRRKQRKDAEEVRRKEVEDYGYNPNEDPTLPAVAAGGSADGPFEMREDGTGGYRGWGATTIAGSSGRKASTTLSGGHSNPGNAPVGMAYSDGTSPSHGGDNRSGDPLVAGSTGRPTSNGSELLGAMGPAAAENRGGNMHRGPSNASSSYSVANRSDGSGEMPVPGGAYGAAQYYSGDANYGGPYADGSYGGAPGGRAEMGGQPVIRDNLARRATRIENPSHFPTQASAGISQNF